MPDPIRTIVMASDFSLFAHRAARRAGLLAKAHGAALQLLHVLDNSSFKSLLGGSASPEVEEKIRFEARQALDSLADDIVRAGGVVTDRSLREGSITEEILAAAAQSQLLVLGPRGLNPLRDFVFGSTAQRVARSISCPMLVVRQDPQIPYQHVLVPVDFSQNSARALRWAADVFPTATLHVFHALDYPLEATLQRAGVSGEASAAYRLERQREANASMDELIAGLDGRAVSTAMQHGDARALIGQRATDCGCTLIVIGKQGRSWVLEHVLGSVTRLVLENAECDVVVVPTSL